MKHIMVFMGTRPEAIKLCPLILELKKRAELALTVVSTGQHRAMLDSALAAFDVKPDLDMGIMRPGQTPADVTAEILRRTDRLIEEKRPDLILVQGDTATAFSATLSAFYRKIPIGHIEAGLRTHRMDAPFPEEFHRQAIGLAAALHFAPTEAAKQNLLREGKPEKSVFVTGNTVVDALRITLTEKTPATAWKLPPDKRILIFTAHRRESLGEPLCAMLRALRRIVADTPDLLAFFPVHRNPAVRREAIEILKGAPRIRLIEPPEIVSFHHLLSHADLVLTDSGGIQEETVALGIPTLVMRHSSERGEGIRAGVLKLAGSQEDGIVSLAKRLLVPGCGEYLAMKKPSGAFGDGHASERIADILENAG